MVGRRATLQPFLAADHWVQPLFPLPHRYGVMLPAALVIIGLSIGATLFGVVMLRSKPKPKAD